jgi:phosphoglycerate kinase
MAKRGLESLGNLSGKRVLMRVDFNVPLRRDGETTLVGDDYRLEMALPTIRALLQARARLILCSHLGRPTGPEDTQLSLAPVAERLGELLGTPAFFCAESVGPQAEAAAGRLDDGQVLVVENLRFHKGEKKGDPEFAQALAKLGEVYVNDAFGVCHRADASVAGVPKLLPAAAGDLVRLEVEKLSPLREGTAPRPYVVVLGGAKLADKIPVLTSLIPKVDGVFVGGGMAYTFLKAMGKPIGKSRVDDGSIEAAQQILAQARERSRETGRELILPIDHVVARGLDDLGGYAIAEEIPDDLMALDIGPRTIAAFVKRLRDTKTVFWNGPLGVFERHPFHLGTHYVASYLAHKKEIATVVGGGDSAAATRQLGLAEGMDWVSTGGGASLEFVKGDELPGLAALPDA